MIAETCFCLPTLALPPVEFILFLAVIPFAVRLAMWVAYGSEDLL